MGNRLAQDLRQKIKCCYLKKSIGNQMCLIKAHQNVPLAHQIYQMKVAAQEKCLNFLFSNQIGYLTVKIKDLKLQQRAILRIIWMVSLYWTRILMLLVSLMSQMLYIKSSKMLLLNISRMLKPSLAKSLKSLSV